MFALPNALTIMRIVLVPVFVVAFVLPGDAARMPVQQLCGADAAGKQDRSWRHRGVDDLERPIGGARQPGREDRAEPLEAGAHPVPVRRRPPQAVEADDLAGAGRVAGLGQIRRPSSSRSALVRASPFDPM